MLVLKRKDGQWVELTHAASGDTIRIRLCKVRPGLPGFADLCFDDDARLFEIQRPERMRDVAVAANVGNRGARP